MKSKIIKYTLLIILGLLMLYQFIPIGDYCDGMANGLLFLALGGLTLLVFLIIVVNNIIKFLKHKQPFDFIPILLFVIIVCSNYSLLKTDTKKFWTTEVLVADLESNNYDRTSRMILYKNNSFGIVRYYHHSKCIIQGSYTIKGDSLTLDKEKLSILTDNRFTSHYIISKSDSTLTALDSTFMTIKISSISEDFD